MRWLQELLVPAAVLLTLAVFWVAADARSLEQKAQHGLYPAGDPALARHVLGPGGPSVASAAQAKPVASAARDGR